MTNLVAIVITFLSTNSFNTHYFDEQQTVDIYCEVWNNKAVVFEYDKQWFTNIVNRENLCNYRVTRTKLPMPTVYSWTTNIIGSVTDVEYHTNITQGVFLTNLIWYSK